MLLHVSMLIALFLSLSIFENTSPDEKYQFKPSNRNIFVHRIGVGSCIGTIDSDGNFKPRLDDLERAIDSFKSGGPRVGSWPANLITREAPNEKVYEYRSGILVPMVFDPFRGLIPEAGGKIIDFKDYQYSPKARRIYNLPGRFVEIVR